MKKYLCILFLLPALLVTLPFSGAKAEIPNVEDDQEPDGTLTSVTLQWDENAESDIAGYNVYYGRASGDYARLETVTEPMATIGVRGNRPVYFAVTAFTSDGVESPLSEEIRWP